MSYGVPQGAQQLYGWMKPNRFNRGLGAMLPEAYKKFWEEWRVKQPTAVHYIPKEGKYERNETTGEVRPVHNVHIPLKFPPESQDQIWGGEGIIQGFQKRTQFKRRVPHFWFPVLRRSVLRSEILNEFMSVVVTDRALALIHDSYGFDHYILKTPACDLKQLLPLRLKRQMLQELQAGCPKLADNPTKQKQVLDEYKKYLEPYTPEQIEWYGYSYYEALKKLEKQLEAECTPVPHKIIFREKLIEQLKTAGIEEAQDEEDNKVTAPFLSRLNPFAKKKEM